jgi:hypothetical protein
MIVYAAIGILILLERRDRRRREQETLDAEKRKKVCPCGSWISIPLSHPRLNLD